MDFEDLAESPIGRLVPIFGPDPRTREMVEGKAFLPDPLPREIELSTETWTLVAGATAA
ncbi:MAG: Fic family protein, partial [Actinobacteria bacterium]|nr:Fic family protein [Actinomycetota bacterium]